MKLYSTGAGIANRYEVVKGPAEDKKLAGGMGLVYLCLDHKNKQPVALKTFRPKFLPDRAARDRFLWEGSTWVQLGRHPHIVHAYDVVRIDDDRTVFLVLEQVARPPEKEDVSLRGWLWSGQPLTLHTALLFGLQIARGMVHAVKTLPGFIHRDLKPENVLVGADSLPGWMVNRVRVTDFGLAKALHGDEPTLSLVEELTNEGSRVLRNTQLTRGVVGTPLYMAPEQWEGRVAGVATDVYAVGLILYEMVVGQMPVLGTNMASLRQAHQEGRLRPIPANIPPTVTQLIRRCLNLNAVDRYQSWEALAEDLAATYTTVTGLQVPALAVPDVLEQADRVALGWAHNSLGESYRDLGKLHIAVRHFERVEEIGKGENEPALMAAGLTGFGNVHADFGDAQRAIGFYEQVLFIARQMGDQMGEGGALTNLGSAYSQLGDMRQAIDYYEQGLVIARKIEDRAVEGQSLGNLGTAYRELGDAQRAITYFEQRLAIARETGDRMREGTTLDNLGMVYFQLGDLRQAIVYQEHALSTAREIGDRLGEGKSLGNLANTYCQMGEIQQGIVFYEQLLDISRETGKRIWEGRALGGLGIAYLQLGEIRRAIDYFEEGLVITKETGDRVAQSAALGSLGSAYLQLGDAQRAIKFYEQDLAITQEIGDRVGEGTTSVNLGSAYLHLGEVRQAISYFEQGLAIARETGNRVGQGKAIGNLGAVYDQLGDWRRAISYYEQHLIISRETGDRLGQAINEFNMAIFHAKHGPLDQALKFAKQATEHFLYLGNMTRLQQAQQLVAQLEGLANKAQDAFDAFLQAETIRAMQQAVARFPLMIQPNFITGIELFLAQQVRPEHRSAFEQHLTWLKQIAQEQAQ